MVQIGHNSVRALGLLFDFLMLSLYHSWSHYSYSLRGGGSSIAIRHDGQCWNMWHCIIFRMHVIDEQCTCAHHASYVVVLYSLFLWRIRLCLFSLYTRVSAVYQFLLLLLPSHVLLIGITLHAYNSILPSLPFISSFVNLSHVKTDWSRKICLLPSFKFALFSILTVWTNTPCFLKYHRDWPAALM